ncbi:MAG: EF-hand domain-containing protein [Phycisphaerae bacterium]|nr:EF-hand domain-containing protein [Phycisphaerae bacterium]
MVARFFSARIALFLLLGLGVKVAAAQPPQGPPRPGGDRGAGEGRPAMIFDRMDANGDGVIDRAEFLAFRDGIRDRISDRDGRRGPADRGFGEGRGGWKGPGGPDGERGMWQRDRDRRGPGRGETRDRSGGPMREGGRDGAHLERLRGVIEESVNDVLQGYPPELRRDVIEAVINGLRHAHERTMGERGGPRGGDWRRGGPDRRDGRRPDAGPGERDGARFGPGKGPDGPPPPPMGGPRRPGWQKPGRDGPPDAKGETPPAADAGRAGRGADMRDGLPHEGRPGELGQQMQFRRMDRNSDGFVTAEEFPGGPERFKAIDRNNDGRLSKEELRDAMRRFRDGGDQGQRPDAARPGQGRGERNARRVVI